MKILDLGDLQLPIPDKYEWLTFDKVGCFLWTKEPEYEIQQGATGWAVHGLTHKYCEALDLHPFYKIKPPEHGPFDKQKYWIG